MYYVKVLHFRRFSLCFDYTPFGVICISVSNLIVREIISVYTVDRSIGTYTNKDRPYSALCIKMSGQSSYTQNGKEHMSDDTHLIFVPQGATYSYTVKSKGSCVIIEFLAENTPDEIQSLVVNESSIIKAILSTMGYAWKRKQTGYREICMMNIYQLLYHIALHKNNTYVPKVHQMRIEKSIDYLHEHLNNHDLTIEAIARRSSISEIYFRRLFTEIYGLSPKKYIIMMRMNRAKELLDSENMSVSEIAESVGFGDVYSFCKTFRKEVGATPTEYKKQLREEDPVNIPGS